MSFDLNSLYPHLIMQYNISPETLVNGGADMVEGMVDKILDGKAKNDTEYCMTPNGAFFVRDVKGFLPELMENVIMIVSNIKDLCSKLNKNMKTLVKPLYSRRISRYDNIQMAKKISLNSLMVLLGIIGFAISILLVATAITTSGQLSIRWIEKSH